MKQSTELEGPSIGSQAKAASQEMLGEGGAGSGILVELKTHIV